ncbi:ferredoxin-type protein NapF [Vibrio sp. B1Z05]|uniref:ferredoxin-type protein NapF n=1 Tax=Vibrio sp. B1Z05 TaxID=2654980 RepID=UPI00128C0406|nr:ferredoxin-type protein NapF [Vibrio sp. B1Z05]MPW35883.1 ferredoxin-type protein NapF [Vibrio sp. B1Z05]
MVDLSKRRLFTRRTPETRLVYETGQRLPWAKTDATFIDGCTQCGQCMQACETNIIINGSGGFPTIDFNKGECTFCQKCVEACPEDIFRSTKEVAWEITARINDTCLATQNVECRTCSDECELTAIQFTFSVGHVAQPKLDSQLCNGCGACLSVCPVTAISMTDCNEDRNASQ